MLYDFSKIKPWLKLSALATFLVQLAFVLLYEQFEFARLFSNRDYFLVLNAIGAYTGFAALIMLIVYPNYFLSYKRLVALTYAALLAFIGLFIFDYEKVVTSASANLVVILSVYSITIITLFIYQLCKPTEKSLYKHLFKDFMMLSTFTLLLGWGTSALLGLIFYLLPNTMDFDVYRIDLAFGGFANQCAHFFYMTAPAWLQTYVVMMYDLLTVFLLLTIGLIIKDNKLNSLHTWQVVAVPFGLAFIMYALMPISGPIYAFSGQFFPSAMHEVGTIAPGMHPIPPASRNGMPSMHLTGSLIIFFMTAALSRKVYFYLACVLVATTFFATLGMGEHYLLDLIVALPFAASLAAILINLKHFRTKHSLHILLLNIAVYCTWVCLLVVNPLRLWLAENHWFVLLFSALSTIAAVLLTAQYFKSFWRNTLTDTTLTENDINTPQHKTVNKHGWVTGVFVASGFAGLLYEVVYAKGLAVTFGGTSLAAYTVLTTYMGGMALGAWIGGVIADKVKNTLKTYALIEAAIGLYALATPMLFKLIQNIYIHIATDVAADAPILTFWRVFLGVVVLGVPTILMGMTLPLMFKYLKHTNASSDHIISRLYTANVAGAAMGALAGGYIVLPTLGIKSATLLAAIISLFICLYSLEKWKLSFSANENDANTNADHSQSKQKTATSHNISPLVGASALAIVTLGGVVTLALEVVNMHMLAVVAGNSVYAFSLMLATFLLGLSLGSWLYQTISKYLSQLEVILYAQFALFFTILFSGVLWNGLVDYFASFAYMQKYVVIPFSGRELIRAFVCTIIMLPPAVFIGLSYPAALGLATDWLGGKAESTKGLGIASFFNTSGNIVGVLLFGFLVLNWVGSHNALQLLALVSLLLSVLFLTLALKHNVIKKPKAVLPTLLLLTGIAFALYPKTWDFQKLSNGANVYFHAVNWGKVIDHNESIEGGITSVAQFDDAGGMTLLTNGKFQGNNTGEVEAQRSFALIPVMHTKDRENALVIGYGTGNSAHVIHEQGFKHVDIVELSKDIVTVADKYFADINQLVSQKNNTKMHYTDGRNYLLTQSKRYDLISMEITSIWFAGAANLYNKEFYELTNKRLTHDGVLQQWIQLHHINKMDLLYIINTARSAFKYVWLYESGGQGIVVASNSKAAFELNAPKHATVTELANKVLLTPQDIDNLVAQIPARQFMVSTDNNLYLEYSTPKGNAIQHDALTENITFLKRFRQE